MILCKMQVSGLFVPAAAGEEAEPSEAQPGFSTGLPAAVALAKQTGGFGAL